MKSLTVILVVLIIFFSLTIGAFAKGDSKYYSEYAFKHKINDKVDVYFTPEFRTNDDMGNMYYYHWRVGSTYHVHQNLDLALAYKYVQTKNSGSEWDKNDTQYIEMLWIPKIKLAGFDLSDANKFERRFIKNARDRWVYRNLFTIAYPTKIGNFEFTPYISNEVYYDFQINKANLNWVTLGLNKKINKYLTVGLYYRDETVRTGTTSRWVTNHILGSNITVNF